VTSQYGIAEMPLIGKEILKTGIYFSYRLSDIERRLVKDFTAGRNPEKLNFASLSFSSRLAPAL
jgi:hypothetical protein